MAIKSKGSIFDLDGFVIDIEKLKTAEYTPEYYFACTRAIAEMRVVGLGYRFGPKSFVGSLFYAANSYLFRQKWLEEHGLDVEYHPDGVHVKHDIDCKTMRNEKEAPYARAKLYAVHEARAALGMDVPDFLFADDLSWVTKKGFTCNREKLGENAQKAADLEHRIGKLAIPDGMNVKAALHKRARELYKAKIESLRAEYEYSVNHLDDIAEIMCDPHFAELNFNYDSESLKEMIELSMEGLVEQCSSILEQATEKAQNAALSHSATRQREGEQLLPVILSVQKFGMTEKQIADMEKRAAEAKAAFEDFDINSLED